MIETFIKTLFINLDKTLTYHESIFGINEEISFNSHLNMKNEIFNLIHVFSLIEPKIKTDLMKQLIDDIFTMMKYFDSFSQNEIIEKHYKEYFSSNPSEQNIGLEEFKKIYNSELKLYRTKAISIINTKLFYLDLYLWSEIKGSPKIEQFLYMMKVENVCSTYDFIHQMEDSFKSIMDFKFIAAKENLKPVYIDAEIEMLNTLKKSDECTQSDANTERLVASSQYIKFFKGLSEMEVRHIVKNVKFIKYNQHEIIINEGKEDEEIYFLLSGSCRVIVGKTVVGVIEKNNAFGEFAPITKERRSATIRANENTTVLSFDIAFENASKYPVTFSKLYKNIIDGLIFKINNSNKRHYNI